MVGDIAGTLARINECRDTDRTCGHCFCHHLMLTTEKKCNACNEAVIVLNIYSSACCFNILCDEVESQHKTLLLHTKAQRLSRGTKSTYVIELQAELATFP